MKRILGFLLLVFFFAGCSSADKHIKAVGTDAGDRITVGKVQSKIRLGMPGADVIEALGSPNMVSTDENRNEVWVYDKIASEVAYSDSDGGFWMVVAGVSGSSGARRTSQRTLTVVIKFDAEQRVRDFAYHSSSF